MNIKKIIMVLSFFCLMAFNSPFVFSCGWGPDFEYWLSGMSGSFFEYSVIQEPFFIYCYPDLDLHAKPGENADYGQSPELALDTVQASRQKEQNLKEWSLYFNNSVPAKDLEEVLYGSESPQVQEKTFLKNKKELIEYLGFIRQVKPFVDRNPYDFYSDEDKPDTGKMNEYLNEAVDKAKNISDRFLKARYGFQAVRLAELLDRHENAIDLHNQYVAPNAGSSLVFYWSQGYKARALWKLNQMTEALKAYRVIFDQSPTLMVMVQQSMRLINPSEPDWNACLGSVKDDYQKEVLWMMKDLVSSRADDLEPLKNMFKLKPKSSHPEVVLMRKILMVESDYLSVFGSGGSGGGDRKSFAVPEQLAAFCEDSVEKVQGLRSPGFWLASAGYLYYISGHYDKATALLDKAKKTGIKNKQLLEQINLIEVLVELSRTKNPLPEGLQKKIVQAFQWAKALTTDQNNWKIYYSLWGLLGNTFSAWKEKGRAAAAYFQAGLDARSYEVLYKTSLDKDLINIYSYVSKPSLFIDKYLLERFPYTPEKVLFLRGKKFLEKDDYKQSSQLFDKLPGSFWKQDEYMLNMSTETPDVCLRISDETPKYYYTGYEYYSDNQNVFQKVSFSEFAGKLKVLKEESLSKDLKKAGPACFTLGNIFYTLPSFYRDDAWYDWSYEKAMGFYLYVMEHPVNKELAFKSSILYTLIAKSLMDFKYNSEAAEKEYQERLKAVQKLIPQVQKERFFQDYAAYCPLFKSFER